MTTFANTLPSRPDGRMLSAGLQILGFSFLLEWFSASGFLSTTQSAAHSDFLTLFVFTVALFLAALCHQFISQRLTLSWMAELGVSALACIGTILPTLLGESFVTVFLSPLVTGCALALLVLQWGKLFSQLSANEVIVQTIVAQTIMSLLHFACSFLPPLPEACVRGILLVVSAAIMVVLMHWQTHDLPEENGEGTVALPLKTPDSTRSHWRPFVRFIIAINLWGMAINQIYNIYRYCSPIDFASLSMPAALIEAAFLGCLLVLALLKAVKDTSLYTIVFSTALLSFLLVPVLGLEDPLPFFAIFLGYCTLSILTWTLSARMCEAYHIDSVVVYGCSIGSFLGLQIIIARTIAPDMFATIASLPIQQNILCLIGAFMCFIAYQLVLNRKSALWLSGNQTQSSNAEVLTSESATEPAPELAPETSSEASPESVADPFAHWSDIAAHFGLTPRESEVVLLFARGRSYERIQETLVISRGTVNYHMTNAYRKLGISSRQELLDLIDSMSVTEGHF